MPSFFQFYLFSGHQFTNLNILSPWVPLEDDQEGCVGMISKTHALNIMCVKQTFILVFLLDTLCIKEKNNQRGLSTRPLLLCWNTSKKGVSITFWQKISALTASRGKGMGWRKKLTGWYPRLLFFFLSEPFPHTLHGCLPERLLYYSSTLLPTSLHTLYILFDLCLMLWSLKNSSTPLTPSWYHWSPTLCNMSPPTCAHFFSAGNNRMHM